ncbi:MAG: hypothetical protein R3F37_22440 [Candidatus Competibacteraceae bacterium]
MVVLTGDGAAYGIALGDPAAIERGLNFPKFQATTTTKAMATPVINTRPPLHTAARTATSPQGFAGDKRIYLLFGQPID